MTAVISTEPCTCRFAALYADACTFQPWPLITGFELFASIVVSTAELTGEPERQLLDHYLPELESSVPDPSVFTALGEIAGGTVREAATAVVARLSPDGAAPDPIEFRDCYRLVCAHGLTSGVQFSVVRGEESLKVGIVVDEDWHVAGLELGEEVAYLVTGHRLMWEPAGPRGIRRFVEHSLDELGIPLADQPFGEFAAVLPLLRSWIRRMPPS
jgi:hypothetical protein